MQWAKMRALFLPLLCLGLEFWSLREALINRASCKHALIP